MVLGLCWATLNATSSPSRFTLSLGTLRTLLGNLSSPMACALMSGLPSPPQSSVATWNPLHGLLEWGARWARSPAWLHTHCCLLVASPWASFCSLPSFLVGRLTRPSEMHSFHFSLSKYLFSSYSVLDTENGTENRTNRVPAPMEHMEHREEEKRKKVKENKV